MAKKGALNGEEYKTIRETLGFSLAEAAEFHKVESINTIKRWEQGESLPTEKACKKILELFEKINFSVEAVLP
jgi:DNA-binding transcriptional regulator YiaG